VIIKGLNICWDLFYFNLL